MLTLSLAGMFVTLVHALRLHLARRAARQELDAHHDRARAPRAGRVVLRGVWRGASVQTATLGDDRVVCEAPSGAWLDCDGERVDIAGEVRVLLGTRRDDYRLRRPDRVPASAPRPIRVTSIADGDTVLVAGIATRVSAEADYRHRAARWILSPRPVTPMRLVAGSPAIAPAPLDAVAWLALVVPLAMLAHAVARIAGG